MIKLKPCPFCGGKASTTKRERWKDESCTYSRPDYGVNCQECYAKGYQYYSTIEEAIEAWNKRAEPPADPWIPCSERLPEENGKYDVRIWDEIIGLYTAEWHFYNGKFTPFTFYTERKILAWKPLPEPYKEGE